MQRLRHRRRNFLDRVLAAADNTSAALPRKVSAPKILHPSFLPDKFDVKPVETYSPAVERIEKERGLKVTTIKEVLDFADVVIFALPDTLIKKLSAEYVPQLIDTARRLYLRSCSYVPPVPKICGDDEKFAPAQEITSCMYRADKAFVMTREC